MNINRIIGLVLLAASAWGCASSDEFDSNVSGSGNNTDSELTFGVRADWATRGVEANGYEDIPELTLYSFRVDPYTLGWESASNETDTQIYPFFSSDIETPITLKKQGTTGNNWSYTEAAGGPRYWRVNNDEALSFVALYPASEFNTIFGTDGKPQFHYKQHQFAYENDDVVCGAKYDMNQGKTTDGKGAVELALHHALTKLTLAVKLKTTKKTTDKQGNVQYSSDGKVYSNEEFHVNGISFYNLYSDGTMSIGDSGVEWNVVEESDKITEVSASEGTTLVPVDSPDEVILDNVDFKDVVKKGSAIFVMPQSLKVDRNKDKTDLTTAPAARIRIRRTFYATEADKINNKLTEVLYESNYVTIPPATGCTGWEAGQHIKLNFEFDVDHLSEFDTPMTVRSEILEWIVADVTVNVRPNIYVYASDNDIKVGKDDTTADLYIYTNYLFDMRFARKREELDGSFTEARGFTFYPYVDKKPSSTAIAPTWVDKDNEEIDYSISTPDPSKPDEQILTANGKKLETKYSKEGAGFYDVSDYFQENVPGDPIPCYPYSGGTTMTETVKWIKFRIGSAENGFYFYLGLVTRKQLGLYCNSSIGDDTSFGINKEENDAVYILRLVINKKHLLDENLNALAADAAVGYFYGQVGAEMLSNAGGLITTKFDVSVEKPLK